MCPQTYVGVESTFEPYQISERVKRRLPPLQTCQISAPRCPEVFFPAFAYTVVVLIGHIKVNQDWGVKQFLDCPPLLPVPIDLDLSLFQKSELLLRNQNFKGVPYVVGWLIYLNLHRNTCCLWEPDFRKDFKRI